MAMFLVLFYKDVFALMYYYDTILAMNVYSLINLLLRSILVGLAIAAPPGPSSVLCIQTTLEENAKSVKALLLGAACAHAFYSLFAASGFAALEVSGVAGSFYFNLLAASLLAYFSFQAWMSFYNNAQLARVDSPAITNDNEDSFNYKKAMFTFVFYLSNPMTIFGYMSFFTTFGVQPSTNLDVMLVVFGTVFGSSLWRYVLVFASRLCKTNFLDNYLLSIRCVCACFMTFFAGCALLRVL